MTLSEFPTAAVPTRPVTKRPLQTRPSSTSRIIGDVLRSEWTRLRTVRSTYWTLLGAAVTMVGLAAVICSVVIAQFGKLTAAEKATFNPVTNSLAGAGLAQLAVKS